MLKWWLSGEPEFNSFCSTFISTSLSTLFDTVDTEQLIFFCYSLLRKMTDYSGTETEA